MDPRLRQLLDRQGGVAAAAQAITLGVSRHEIYRLARKKEVIRLPRGIIADPTTWHESPRWERHALRARGLMYGPAGDPASPVALSHHSALSLRGHALFEVDDRVHTVRTDGRRSRSDQFHQAHPAVPESWVTSLGRLRFVRPEFAGLQVAATVGIESGMVSIDSLLQNKAITQTQLREALASYPRGNGHRQAAQAVELADGRSESAGESRCRWAFVQFGMAMPTPQATIRDENGAFVARVDFLFEKQRMIVEFDGLQKYTERSSLVDEKRREDALRALRYVVVRITWDELDDLAELYRKLARALRSVPQQTPTHR